MKNNIRQYAYFIAFFIKLVTILCREIPVITQFDNYLNYFVLFLLLIVFLIQIKNYKTKELILIVISTIILGISAFVCRDTILLQLLLFIVCYKDIELEKFFKFSLISKIAILLVVIALWKMGIIDEVITHRSDGNIIRHSWGLSHPNGLGLILFSICCDLFCLHYKKIKIYDIAIFIASLLISIFVCNSRAAQIGLVSLLICAFIIPKLENNLIFKKSIIYLPLLLFLMSLALTIIYPLNYSFVQKINELLSSRIFYSNSFLNHYGISVFGNNFINYGNLHGEPWNYALDCGYMFLLIKFGALTAISFLLLITFSIIESIKSKKYFVILYLVPFLLYGLIENYVLYFQYNTILILCGSLLFRTNKKE